MIATVAKNLTFAEFLEVYPEGKGAFELVHGEITEMRATREHELVADFLLSTLKEESKRQCMDFFISNNILIKTSTITGQEQGRIPDIGVVEGAIWRSNLKAYAALQEPIKLVIEVTSTNWHDDYVDKLDEYERLGISEYWIVDYLAIAPMRYLSKPKVPTVFVYSLDPEIKEYECKAFKGLDQILSQIFPDLSLTMEQILEKIKQ